LSKPYEAPRPVPSYTGPSQFVTVTAWIFIGLSTLATLIALMQNIVVGVMFQTMPIASIESVNPPPPRLAVLMFEHARLVFLFFLVVSAATLFASIGLLKRRNWARVLFIAMLAIGILWNLTGLVLQQVVVSSMADFGDVAPAPPDFEATMRGMMIAIRVFSALFAIGICVLFGWIIQRLRSPAIAAEFG
jgi:hypothetical protein